MIPFIVCSGLLILGYKLGNSNCAELQRDNYKQGREDQKHRQNILINSLEKIADPRKRDHSEPDAYTELGCVMNIANQALEEFRNDE